VDAGNPSSPASWKPAIFNMFALDENDEMLYWGELIDPRPIAPTSWTNPTTVGCKTVSTTAVYRAVWPKGKYEERLAALREVLNS